MQVRISFLSIAVIFLLSGRAFGFAEDVCFTDDGRILDCQPWPEDCELNETSQICATKVVANITQQNLQATRGPGSGRSTIHLDATYILAQSVGFSSEQAHLIAAYDQATDIAQYVPRKRSGELIIAPELCENSVEGLCRYVSRDVTGVTRSSFATGGQLFHFIPPTNFDAPRPQTYVDGQNPEVSNARTEGILHHVRRWAENGELFCTGGMTNFNRRDNSYATGDACFGSRFFQGVIRNVMPIVANLTLNFRNNTGPQRIAGSAWTPIEASDFSQYVGNQNAAFARIGVYMHALQDRVSHSLCLDDSFFHGPTGRWSERVFEANAASPECTQDLHFIRHSWETGVDQSQLLPQNRTTEAALRVSYEELLRFAEMLGLERARAYDGSYREEVITTLIDALSVSAGDGRVDALTDSAKSLGLQPLPGY